ncbi:MAG: hypothetical protein QNJ94_00820 [Alphaproteobacteria bacterium]|nr:hypothetical protein [Alphaproteobacteria bacterium]
MVRLFDTSGYRRGRCLLAGAAFVAVASVATTAQAAPVRLVQQDELGLGANAVFDDELKQQRGAGLDSGSPAALSGAPGNSDVAVILWDDYPDGPATTNPGMTLSGNVNVNSVTGAGR